MDTYFSNLYRDPHRTSALGGRDKFLASVTQERKDEGKRWLMGEDAYTLHKPARLNFGRRKTIASGPGEQLQADLLDVHSMANMNEGVTFLMTIIDIFSKKAWVIPLQKKSGLAVATGLREIFTSLKSYRLLQTDKGKEFLNKDVKRVLRDASIEHFTSENATIKAAVVERFNRTIRGKIYRHLTANRTEHFLSSLPAMVGAYNKTVHTSTGVRPTDVTNSNKADIWNQLYEPNVQPTYRKISFNKSDYVRISKSRGVFDRGYTPNWTTEIFQIESIIDHTTPVVYTLIDLGGERLVGTFYEKELQQVSEPKTFVIEEVIKSKGRGSKRQHLVKWLGYPISFNSWVSSEDLV